MGQILTGDQAKTAFRKLGEIARQLGQDEYPHDPERLLGALQALTEGRFEVVATSFPSQIYCPELIPEYTDKNGSKRRWDVLEDVAPSQFDVGKLKPRSFLHGNESSISSEEMRKRARQFKANLGLLDGKRLLAEQDKIPPEFRGFYIPLPDTLLRGSDGSVHVPDLYFHGDRWYLSFRWLGRDWDGRGRFACSE